jgi:tetratricopeptide (TPR) repeat protein
MAPNGLMNVWTGLLLRVDNEAQLAAVLSHEIGHYLRRHSVQLYRDARDKTNAAAFISVGLGAFGPLIQLAAIGSVFSYKRDMEREADGYSLLLMARAGYDPREAHKIWDRILKEKEADPDAEKGPFLFATHPPSKERRDALDDLGGKVFDKLGADTIGTEKFRAIVAPYKTELLHDEIDLRNFERSVVLFDMLLENDPNPAEILFFKGELHRVRDDEKEGDVAAALNLYDEALATEGKPPTVIYRAMGLLHRRQGNAQAAASAFRTYLELEPDNVERPFIESIIEDLETS